MNIKDLLQKALEMGIYSNLNEIAGMYFIEAEVLENENAKAMLKILREETKKIFEEYEVDGHTPLKEVLEKMNLKKAV